MLETGGTNSDCTRETLRFRVLRRRFLILPQKRYSNSVTQNHAGPTGERYCTDSDVTLSTGAVRGCRHESHIFFQLEHSREKG